MCAALPTSRLTLTTSSVPLGTKSMIRSPPGPRQIQQHNNRKGTVPHSAYASTLMMEPAKAFERLAHIYQTSQLGKQKHSQSPPQVSTTSPINWPNIKKYIYTHTHTHTHEVSQKPLDVRVTFTPPCINPYSTVRETNTQQFSHCITSS